MYEGRAFEYCKGLSAFQSGRLDSSTAVVLIGGLYDGINTLPYAESLSEYLKSKNISLIQPILPSSYHGFGHSSIHEDAKHLDILLRCINSKLRITKVVILGHSTGCQDIMAYASSYQCPDGMAVGAILQGPVSDRDYWVSRNPALVQRILQWSDEHEPDRLYPELIDGVPMTNRRIQALMSRLGEDDYFSVDITDGERKAKLPTFNLSCPMLALCSGADEYFPFGPDQLKRLMASFERCWPVKCKLLPGAKHALNEPGDLFTIIDTYISNVLNQ